MYTRTEKIVDWLMAAGGIAFYVAATVYLTAKLTGDYFLNLM